MRVPVMVLAIAVTLVSVARAERAGLVPWPVQASPERSEALGDRAVRLDALFALLRAARDEAEAARATWGIWQLWTQSGRDDIDVLMEEARQHMAGGRHVEALDRLDEVVKLAPEFAEGWNRRATLLFMMRQFDRSLADIEEVLKLEPRHFGALAGRGMIHIERENWEAALQAYRAALRANPWLSERNTVIPALIKRLEGDPI